MSNIFEKIVNHLSICRNNQFSTIEVSRDLNMKHEQVVGVIRSVHKIGDYFILNDKCQESWKLTELGLTLLEQSKKSKISTASTTVKDVGELVKPHECDKETYFNLNFIRNGGTFDNDTKLDYYKNKNYVEKTKLEYLEGEIIDKEALANLKLQYDVTEEILKNDNWKSVSLLPYNFGEMAAPIAKGSLHLVTRMVNKIRQILLEIGFTEQPTTPLIDDPFWSKEAMLAQGSNEEEAFVLNHSVDRMVSKEIRDRIRILNEELFCEDCTLDAETVKPTLRQNLNNSIAKILCQATNNNQYPQYQFTIENIVSAKTSDSLHLPEYHMAAIVLMDTQLKFNDILGLLDTIFKRLNIENVEYKPAYSSYSSPTLESLCYHFGLDQWIGIGKSGIVSKELMKAMNFSENLVALALTLNIERIIMIQHDFMDINNTNKLA